jgi:hypothetical protein
MSRFLLALTAGVTLFLGPALQANAMTVTWQNEAFTGISNVFNNENFDSGQITFTGFQANELRDVFGLGQYHNHSGTKTFTMELRLDGVWTPVWTDTISSSSNIDRLMDDITTPISFPLGVVSGIWLHATLTGQAFHLNLGGSGTGTHFNFNTVAAVPIPAALPLFASGLIGLALLAWRRKQKPSVSLAAT